MADKTKAFNVAAALQQQFDEQFKPQTQTAADVVAQTTGAAGASASQFGMTPAQLEAAMSSSVSSYQAQDKANAYAPVLQANKALESWGNNGIYASQADQDLAQATMNRFTDEQLAQLVDPSNIAQGIQVGGTFTNPDDQRSLMTYNDLSMLGPYGVTTTANPTYNAQSFETPMQLTSTGEASGTGLTTANQVSTPSFQDTFTNDINSSGIDRINQQYVSSFGALDREATAVDAATEQEEREAITAQRQADKAFSDWVAEQGASGVAGQGIIAGQGALTSNLADIGARRTASLSDIESQRSDLEQEKAYDIRATQAEEADAEAAAELEQTRYDQELALAIAELTGMYNGEFTLQGKQALLDMATQEAEAAMLEDKATILAQEVQMGNISLEAAELELQNYKDQPTYTTGTGATEEETTEPTVNDVNYNDVNEYIDSVLIDPIMSTADLTTLDSNSDPIAQVSSTLDVMARINNGELFRYDGNVYKLEDVVNKLTDYFSKGILSEAEVSYILTYLGLE